MQPGRICKMKLNDLVLRYLKSFNRTRCIGCDSPPAGELSPSPRSSCDFDRGAEDCPPGLRDLLDERAAIMEYEGKMERTEAEKLALDDVTSRFD